ncbi:MAG: hypothetical protein AB8B64_06195 [Granulosicoccus sp.]
MQGERHDAHRYDLIGFICSGISSDLAHSLNVMDEFALAYSVLQFVGDKEVGDQSNSEILDIKALMDINGTPASCILRHVFADMSTANNSLIL